jgi:hypothetical protein
VIEEKPKSMEWLASLNAALDTHIAENFTIAKTGSSNCDPTSALMPHWPSE